jgi:protein-disulfide isomerase
LRRYSGCAGPQTSKLKDCKMPLLRFLALAIAAAVLLVPRATLAQSFSDEQRTEIHKIIKEYLLANPELIEEAQAELTKRQQVAEAIKQTAGVKKHAELLFNSPRGVIVGGKDGDVNFVEFFDYNCGFCKKAMADMIDLMKDDPKLRVTLKEFPVLGPPSVEAAQVAVAVRMQDQGGKKYLDFHQKLLGSRGPADKAKAMAAAKEAGLDMARLEKDIASPEVKATIEENFRMAEDIGLNGTPSYVIGDQVVVGAIGAEALKDKIASARKTIER